MSQMGIDKAETSFVKENQLNITTHNGGYHSNTEGVHPFLPAIHRVQSKSSNRTQLTNATEQTTKYRKASPEALALMMRNIQGNKQSSSKVWVPNGSSTTKKDQKPIDPKKLFY